MNTTVNAAVELPIGDVLVEKRFRKDYGDIGGLAQSIEAIGLLHPIVVDSNSRLIVGERRLRACKHLGWEKIPANIVATFDDAMAAIQAERDENTCRKELLPSEAVAIGLQLEDLEKEDAKRRKAEGRSKGGKAAGNGRPQKSRSSLNETNATVAKDDPNKNKVSAKVGASVGMPRSTYEKAREVVASGDKEIIAEMDRTGKVGPALNRVRQKKKKVELEQKAQEVEQLHADQPLWTLICGDTVQVLRQLDDQDRARLIFADPPYNIGIDYGNGVKADLLPGSEYLEFCRQWIGGCRDNLTDDGSFWLLVSDEYAAELCVLTKSIGFTLRSWVKWFEGFGVNCTNNFNRTTRHIFWFVMDPDNFVFNSHEVMRPSDRQTKYNDKRAVGGGKIENDLWDIPRLTGTCQERIPGFPTQLPLALVDRIVRCASEPGDLVIDPFNGSGTTGVAAVKNLRKYIGIDLSEEYIGMAEKRLRCVK